VAGGFFLNKMVIYKFIINKDVIFAFWLRDQQKGEERSDIEIEKKLSEEDKKKFGAQFEEVWKEDYPRLRKWQNKMTDAPYRFSHFFDQVNGLLNTNYEGEVHVILSLTRSDNRAKVAFDHFGSHTIALGVSRVKYKYLAAVFRVLVKGTIKLVSDQLPDKKKIEEEEIDRLLDGVF
jgi:hypothetical protein